MSDDFIVYFDLRIPKDESDQFPKRQKRSETGNGEKSRKRERAEKEFRSQESASDAESECIVEEILLDDDELEQERLLDEKSQLVRIFPQTYRIDHTKLIPTRGRTRTIIYQTDGFNDPLHCMRLHRLTVYGVPCIELLPPSKRNSSYVKRLLDSTIRKFNLQGSMEFLFPESKIDSIADDYDEIGSSDEEESSDKQNDSERKNGHRTKTVNVKIVPVYLLPYLFYAMKTSFSDFNDVATVCRNLETQMVRACSVHPNSHRDDHMFQLKNNIFHMYESLQRIHSQKLVKARATTVTVSKLIENNEELRLNIKSLETKVESLEKQNNLLLKLLGEQYTTIKEHSKQIQELHSAIVKKN